MMLCNQIIASFLHLPLSWFIKNLFRDNRMLSRLGVLFDAIFRARGATRTREGSVLFGSTSFPSACGVVLDPVFRFYILT